MVRPPESAVTEDIPAVPSRGTAHWGRERNVNWEVPVVTKHGELARRTAMKNRERVITYFLSVVATGIAWPLPLMITESALAAMVQPQSNRKPPAADRPKNPKDMTVDELLQQGRSLRRDGNHRSALAYFKEARNRNSPDGTFEYAMMLARGEGINQNKQGAMETLLIAADELHHAEAAAVVGQLYLSGEAKDPRRTTYAQDYGKALKYLNLAVDRGFIPAKETLAAMYANGRGVEWDFERALALLREVEAAGSLRPWSLILLGELHRDGLGTPVDLEAAERRFRQALDAKFPVAATRLAQLELRQGKPGGAERAVSLLAQAVDSNDAEGMVELSRLKLKGEGAAADIAGSVALLERAAKLNFGDAKFELSKRYWSGVGLSKNQERAEHLLLEAANAGSVNAMLTLAWRDEQGGSRVGREGERWYLAAAKLGNTLAMNRTAEVLWAEATIRNKNAEAAAAWCRRAAQRGNAPAMNRLGLAYQLGDSVPQDFAEAKRWYSRAIELGVAEANLGLGTLYDRGLGVAVDGAKALEFYTKAADAGSGSAVVLIATMYIEGRGVPRDVTKGVEFLRRGATDKSAAPAMRELGRVLLDGDGVDKNPEEGRAWLRKAAEAGDGPAMFMLGKALLDETGDKGAAEAEEWLTKADSVGERRATLSLAVLTAARINLEGAKSGSSEMRNLIELAAMRFRRAERLGLTIPPDYKPLLDAADRINAENAEREAREFALSPLPGASRGMGLLGGQFTNSASGNAAYDAGAALRDFQRQTAGDLGALGIYWQ